MKSKKDKTKRYFENEGENEAKIESDDVTLF